MMASESYHKHQSRSQPNAPLVFANTEIATVGWVFMHQFPFSFPYAFSLSKPLSLPMVATKIYFHITTVYK